MLSGYHRPCSTVAATPVAVSRSDAEFGLRGYSNSVSLWPKTSYRDGPSSGIRPPETAEEHPKPRSVLRCSVHALRLATQPLIDIEAC